MFTCFRAPAIDRSDKGLRVRPRDRVLVVLGLRARGFGLSGVVG